MLPDDPRHGTNKGFEQHRRDNEDPCDACREGRRLYSRRYHKVRELGYVLRVKAGHGGVWQEIDRHMSGTYSYARLADAMGTIGADHLFRIHAAGPDGMIYPATWKRLREGLRNVKPAPTQIGTLRRLQALHRMGHTINSVMDDAGLPREIGKRALRGHKSAFAYATVCAIADTYERMAMRLPEPSAGATRAKRRAEREGWPPPLAWDDIDDPDERPHGSYTGLTGRATGRKHTDIDESIVDRLLTGERIPSTAAEKREAMRRWLATGKTEAALCAIHGWKEGRYKDRTEAAA